MNAVVTVHGHAVERLYYRGQPVLTLPMIDELHDRPAETSAHAFRRKKDLFTEGVHFFEVPYTEWKPLLDAHGKLLEKRKKADLKVSKRNLQEMEKVNLVSHEIGDQEEEKAILNSHEMPVQDEKKDDLGCHEMTDQDGEVNYDFSFPDPPERPVSSAAEMPETSARTVRTKPKYRQSKLPHVETVKKHGGRRGSMYFMAAPGYTLLTRIFDDAVSWAIMAELVNSYYGLNKRRSRRISRIAA